LSPVTIQIGGKQVTSMTLLPASVGEKVTVTYTIGRSGTYYIDYFKPALPGLEYSYLRNVNLSHRCIIAIDAT
jgi:hypothetical protein